MSNYVRNYVFCNEALHQDFQKEDYNDRMFKWPFYNLESIPLKDSRYVNIFDTKGSDYKEEYIRPIIYKYNDTVWYCIEENNIKQGMFSFDGKDVVLQIRKLAYASKECVLCILYTDKELRPMMSVFVFPGKIVIEEYMFNRSSTIVMSDSSRIELSGFIINMLYELTNAKEPHRVYTTSEEKEVWEQCWIWGDNNDREILIENESPELYQEGDPEAGEALLDKIKNLIHKICLDNGHDVKLTYETIHSFIQKEI